MHTFTRLSISNCNIVALTSRRRCFVAQPEIIRSSFHPIFFLFLLLSFFLSTRAKVIAQRRNKKGKEIERVASQRFSFPSVLPSSLLAQKSDEANRSLPPIFYNLIFYVVASSGSLARVVNCTDSIFFFPYPFSSSFSFSFPFLLTSFSFRISHPCRLSDSIDRYPPSIACHEKRYCS